MAITLPSFGLEQMKNQHWESGLIINPGPAELTPAELFDLDPTLPFQGLQPHPALIDLHYVVIPRGRIVGAVPRNMTVTGRPQLTFADGDTVKPLGYAPENIFGKVPHRVVPLPRYYRAGYIEVPYIAAINGANGTLEEGDYVSAHFGSTTSRTNRAIEDMGKPVKWVEKKVYMSAVSATPTTTLAAATLPGIQPRVICGFNSGAYVAAGTTPVWNTTAGKWETTFGGTVTHVLYEYGQSVDQRAAQVVRLKQVSSSQEAEGWLKWVEQDFQGYQYPPMMQDYPLNTRGDLANASAGYQLTSDSVVDANTFNLPDKFIAPHRQIKVYISTGSVLDVYGTSTQISATVLSAPAGQVFENFCVGEHYRIDFIKGVLYIDDNLRNPDGSALTYDKIKVSYEYNADYDLGLRRIVDTGTGLRGQTDGRYTGLPGTPTHLERAAGDALARGYSISAGSFGALRLTFDR